MSDRELDKLVHLNVFKHTLINNKPLENLYIPHYSTNIAAAWEVVQHMRQKDFEIGIFSNGGGLNYFEAHFHLPNFSKQGRALGISAPAAICLAALKAVGVEL
jgi:ABC-type glycerol-3-phosphate transport system substrate-binding protein